MYNMVVGRY